MYRFTVFKMLILFSVKCLLSVVNVMQARIKSHERFLPKQSDLVTTAGSYDRQ